MHSDTLIRIPTLFGLLIVGMLIPFVVSAQSPSVNLIKTVGTTAGVCAPTSTITVPIGTDVEYCYTVENTGDVTFTIQHLVDDQLGVLLASGPITLAPGGSLFYLRGEIINSPVINTATWTAVDSDFDFAADGTIAPVWEDISPTGIELILADDSFQTLPIGFSFNYCGVSYTTIDISSNGFLSVLPLSSSYCCDGQPLPNHDLPNGTIAGWWEDLDPSEGGAEIHYQTLGTAPNRYLVISLLNVPHFPNYLPVSLQYKLYETTNVVEVHYLSAQSDGGVHSAGLENQDGTFGLQYYLGTDTLTPFGPVAVRYTPEPNLSASDSDSAEVLIFAGPNVDVDPLSLAVDVGVDTTRVEPLNISNTGSTALDWSILEEGAPTRGAGEQLPCVNPSDVPWLAVNPVSGTIASAGTAHIDVTFDATGLPLNTYSANLCVASNDPDPGPGNSTDLVVVVVEMTVIIPVELQSFSVE